MASYSIDVTLLLNACRLANQTLHTHVRVNANFDDQLCVEMPVFMQATAGNDNSMVHVHFMSRISQFEKDVKLFLSSCIIQK